MRTFSPIIAAALLLVPVAVPAQAPAPPQPTRGTIQSLQNDKLTLKTDDGQIQTITLAPQWGVSVLKRVEVSAIQPGSFIGTAEMPQQGNTGRSLEVHVFPPGQKGGEGHYPWNLKQGSMMTNGTVGKVTEGAKGRELLVSYPNGERKIIVPPGVPIVQMSNGERAQIKPGLPAFLLAGKAPDGTLTANFIAIGENGSKPPM